MIINLGDAPFKAFITVTYPSGTCTVSNGTKSYTHTGGGTHTFTVHGKGVWTVSAVNGSSNASKTVSISSRGQVENVTLSYHYYLFNNGKVSGINWVGSKGTYSSYTIGSTIKVTRNGQYNNEWADAWATTAINLTNYSKLCVNVTARSGSNLSIGVATKQDAEPSDVVASKSVNSTGVCELDISSIKTSRYIYVVADYLLTQQVPGSMTVSQVWLE